MLFVIQINITYILQLVSTVYSGNFGKIFILYLFGSFGILTYKNI